MMYWKGEAEAFKKIQVKCQMAELAGLYEARFKKTGNYNANLNSAENLEKLRKFILGCGGEVVSDKSVLDDPWGDPIIILEATEDILVISSKNYNRSQFVVQDGNFRIVENISTQ